MRIGILCSGGPAPGFNGVIEGVVRAATARGWEVIGIPYGYRDLMTKQLDQCRPLGLRDVAGIETRGGSIIFTNRANPRKSPAAMAGVVESVQELGLRGLITVGGDDTATAARSVAQALTAEGKEMRVAHIPKTIDNDLPLPGMAPTFGYETARSLGAHLCRNLRVDAITTSRWYLVTAMGRSAGHLALGMAMGSGADLVVIREEFERLTVANIAALVATAIERRKKEGQAGGLVILAEGLLELLDPDELQRHVGTLEADEHGNPRMSEIDLGRIVRDAAQTIVPDVAFITKILGYELRCEDPCPFDVQYTRTLGAGAVGFLAEGEGDALISFQGDKVIGIPLDGIQDADGRVPVRRVDIDGDLWKTSIELQAR